MAQQKLYLQNSLTRKKELFSPIGEVVKIYSCGPTVYDYPHVGNFRSFLFSDLLNRTLQLFGYKTCLVMNITDIDDKTIKGANTKGLSLKDFTKKYTDTFLDDTKKLRMLKADFTPNATDHIDEIIEMIQTLLEKKHAYISDGSVYFSTISFAEYGKLSNLKTSDQIAGKGGRINHDEYERDDFSDFVLWKKYQADDGEVKYESPFGPGRPGWHIECSAMSKKYLGESFDIHTGGIDNRFPHHENEIAQSTCSSGKEFVNYWLHVEHLLIEGQKMSKSLGNTFTIAQLIEKGIPPLAIRYSLLSTHYRTTFNFTFDTAKGNQKALERLQRLKHRLEDFLSSETDELKIIENTPAQKDIRQSILQFETNFTEALADDLNTAKALANVFDFSYAINNALDKKQLNQALATQAFDFLEKSNRIFVFFDWEAEEEKTTEEINDLIKVRNEARAKKDFAKADEIRKKLISLGFEIEDTPTGTKTKKILN